MGGDLAKMVELEVLGVDALRRLGVNDFEVKLVGLGHGADGSRPRVALYRCYVRTILHV